MMRNKVDLIPEIRCVIKTNEKTGAIRVQDIIIPQDLRNQGVKDAMIQPSSLPIGQCDEEGNYRSHLFLYMNPFLGYPEFPNSWMIFNIYIDRETGGVEIADTGLKYHYNVKYVVPEKWYDYPIFGCELDFFLESAVFDRYLILPRVMKRSFLGTVDGKICPVREWSPDAEFMKSFGENINQNYRKTRDNGSIIPSLYVSDFVNYYSIMFDELVNEMRKASGNNAAAPYEQGCGDNAPGKAAVMRSIPYETECRLDDLGENISAVVKRDYAAYQNSMQGRGEAGQVPLYAFLGEHGTGKSSTAEMLAEMYERELVRISPAILASPYKGQQEDTLSRELRAIYAGDNDSEGKKRLGVDTNRVIILIDPAELFGNDSHSKDVIPMIEQILNGEKRELHCRLSDQDGESFILELIDPPVIWLEGDELETQKCIFNEAPKLCAMYKKLYFDAPSPQKLSDKLIALLSGKSIPGNGISESNNPGSNDSGNSISTIDPSENNHPTDMVPGDGMAVDEKGDRGESVMKNAVQKCRAEFGHFFAWANSEAFKQYFDNYKWLHRFHEMLKSEFLMAGGMLDINEACNIIKKLITEEKKRINREYSCRYRQEHKNERHFEITKDIPEGFNDFAGYEPIKTEFMNLIHMYQGNKKYGNIVPPGGVLFVGPPGTGKTHFARCLAGEVQERFDEDHNYKQCCFISVSAAELVGNADKIRVLFRDAASYDFGIIFIDEIDTIGRSRQYGSNPYYSELTVLMTELDGFEEHRNVFVIAATNAPDTLDPALKRPGRFDREIVMDYPNREDRQAIIHYYLKKYYDLIGIDDLDSRKDIEGVVEEMITLTNSRSISMIKTMINDAMILFVESKEDVRNYFADKENDDRADDRNDNDIETDKPVRDRADKESFDDSMKEKERTRHYAGKYSQLRERLGDEKSFNSFLVKLCFEEVHARSIAGRRNDFEEDTFSMSENKGKSSIAVHGIGHAMISLVCGVPFEHITVRGRGKVGGYLLRSNEEGELAITKSFMENQIKISMAGRIAEEVVYGEEEVSNGASKDILDATYYVRMMVRRFGMSELGFMALQDERDSFLGGSNVYLCSASLIAEAERIERDILKRLYEETKDFLEENKGFLITSAKYLFDKGLIRYREFEAMYSLDRLTRNQKED